MSDPALFEIDERPLRERVAATIMPAPFGPAKEASWAPGARRRTLEIADQVLAVIAESGDSR